MKTNPTLLPLLEQAAALDPALLNDLVDHMLALRAQQQTPALSEQETLLLQRINQGLDPETQARYDHLEAKRQAEALTDAEHEELLALLEHIEMADAERMQALTTLAAQRGCSVADLMATLGIRQPVYL